MSSSRVRRGAPDADVPAAKRRRTGSGPNALPRRRQSLAQLDTIMEEPSPLAAAAAPARPVGPVSVFVAWATCPVVAPIPAPVAEPFVPGFPVIRVAVFPDQLIMVPVQPAPPPVARSFPVPETTIAVSGTVAPAPAPAPVAPVLAAAAPAPTGPRAIMVRFKVLDRPQAPLPAGRLHHLDAICVNAAAAAVPGPGPDNNNDGGVLDYLGLRGLRIDYSRDVLIVEDLHPALAWLFANSFAGPAGFVSFLSRAMAQFSVLRWVARFRRVVVPASMAVCHVLRELDGQFYRRLPPAGGEAGGDEAEESVLRFLSVFGHQLAQTREMVFLCGVVNDGLSWGGLTALEMVDLTGDELAQMLEYAKGEFETGTRRVADVMGRADHNSIGTVEAIWGAAGVVDAVRVGAWVPYPLWTTGEGWVVNVSALLLVRQPGQYL
ncbi:hypothetical protein B0H66DRAFT_607495 [Apodospora peruviana]|uniref:Uncharacterized protein n=1 Tax=Apodospora peruviana TaxID=516989 RepID=A0AAE0M0C7_9PEZI|nr:hypothetical protein B0H66DRAFT_607495 [Apodospora peruviana]